MRSANPNDERRTTDDRTKPVPQFQAILLDMDGVVIDSEPLHEKAQRIIFHEFELDVPEAAILSFKGMTEKDVFERIVREYAGGEGDVDVLIAAKERTYRELLKDLQLIPDALSFIRNAHRRYRLALTTSSVRFDQRIAFNKFDLASYFETVVTAEDIVYAKPHPQPYLTTAEKLGVEPSECLVVEDSLNGVRSAIGAGCTVAGMTTSFDREQLEKAGVHFTIDTYEELADRLGVPLD